MNLDLTNLAILSVIAACWRQMLGLYQRLRSLLVTHITIDGRASHYLVAYLHAHAWRPRFGDRFFRSQALHVRPLERVAEVAWEVPPKQPMLFFYHRTPVLIGSSALPSQQYADGAVHQEMVSLALPRWIDAETLLLTAMTWALEQQTTAQSDHSRHAIYHISMDHDRHSSSPSSQPHNLSCSSDNLPSMARYLGWTQDQIGPPKPSAPMGALALSPSLLTHVHEFRRWLMSKNWYKAHGIPWRRGWLLHGQPGTGKTSLIRALAQEHDLPVFVYDLTTLNNHVFAQSWRQMQSNTPCLALIEDIDTVFNGRQNVHATAREGSILTFDALLNALSGVETCDGVFICITTNHLEKVDPALSRPGRLDAIIEVPTLGREQLLTIAERILGDWPAEVAAVMTGTQNLTGAQMTERCVARAISRYWDSTTGTTPTCPLKPQT